MGLNFKYLLYFQKDRIWDILKGMDEYCDTAGMKPATIRFPDYDLVIPLTSSWGEENIISHDKSEIDFAISMNFEEDPALIDYLINQGNTLEVRSPPGDDTPHVFSIGFIYLTVYPHLINHYAFEKPSNLSLFMFDTTGTKMSLLFSESISIRKTFIKILRNFQGVAGIFDREIDGGELFWFRGKEYALDVGDVYMLPEQIEETIRRGW